MFLINMFGLITNIIILLFLISNFIYNKFITKGTLIEYINSDNVWFYYISIFFLIIFIISYHYKEKNTEEEIKMCIRALFPLIILIIFPSIKNKVVNPTLSKYIPDTKEIKSDINILTEYANKTIKEQQNKKV